MNQSAARPARVQLFGVPIDACTMQDAIGVIGESIAARRRLLIGVVNAAKIVNMRKDPLLRDSVLSADLILADGMSVVWASRLLGARLPERVAGIDLMQQLFAESERRGWSVYCLGATQEVLDQVLATLRRDFPKLRLAGARHGYFSEAEEGAVAAEIGAARPDILFAAMSSPKKEKFLARWSDTMNVCVCHGVGGSFDVVGGKVRRAPQAWQRFGAEWLYRLLQEPGRLWKRYLVTNTVFAWLVVKAMAARLVGARTSAA